MSTAIQKQPSTSSTLRTLLESRRGLLAQVAPKHLNPDRMIKIALASVGRNETLQKCSGISILQACVQSAEVGLEIGGVLQHAALVPFWNSKTNSYEAQFQPMYKGLLHLVRNSGDVLDVQTAVVYAKDKFRYERGLTPKLKHVPALEVDRGEITHFYAVVRFKSGGSEWEVMTKAEVDVIKAKVLSRQKGGARTWEDHYEEMGKKTVLKRTLKLCPVSAEAARVIAQDDALERGETAPVEFELPLAASEPAAEPHDVVTGEVLSSTVEEKASPAPAAADSSGPKKASAEYERATAAILAAQQAKDLAALEACAALLKEIHVKPEHTDAIALYRAVKAELAKGAK